MTIHSKLVVLFMIVLYLFGCGEDKLKNADTAILEKNDSTNHIQNGALSYVQAYDKTLTLWKTPFEEKEIKTSYGTAHVIVCGPINGDPLVLLHGMNASSTMWYPNIESLSKHFRIYAIDFLLEPGKSVCQGEVSGNSQVVDWYYEIFDELHLQKFNLLGASRGGWLALDIAIHSKSRVNKIALLSPAQAFTWIKPLPKFVSNITYTISPKRKRLRHVLQTMTFDVDKISQVYIDQYYIGTKEAKINKCILQMTPFSDNELESLTMPILVLIGDNDIINNEKSLEKAKKVFPNVETEIIKNAGHFLSVDQPEIVDRKIIDFFNDNKNLSAKR